MAWSHGRGWIYFLFALSAFLFDSFCLTTAGMAELLPFFFPSIYPMFRYPALCIFTHTSGHGLWDMGRL